MILSAQDNLATAESTGHVGAHLLFLVAIFVLELISSFSFVLKRIFQCEVFPMTE